MTTYTYDASGNKLSKTDARGNTWTYSYDANDRLLAEADPFGYTIFYEYDAVGNRIKAVDQEGHITYFEYDALKNLTRSISKIGDTSATPDDDDIVTTYTFDCLGRRIAENNALDETTTWTFDFRGKVLTETNTLGEIKSYTYDENGNKITETTKKGNIIYNSYDALNRLVYIGDTVGPFVTFQYDGVGNKTREMKADGTFSTYSYTTFNKMATSTDALGNTTTYTYDKNYNLVSVTDRLGKTRTMVYDALNRQTEITDPMGNITSMTYDEMGNLKTFTDANGNTTTYTYDEANRNTVIEFADATTKSVTFSPAGRVTSKTDQNGNVINYERDDVYRIISRQYPDATQWDYTYDKLGRLVTATNSYGTVTFAYDAAGRMTSIDQNGTLITYAHDTEARTRTINYPGGKSVVETFTIRDKLSQVADATDVQTLVTYSYDELGRPKKKTFDVNGVTTTYSYNANSMLTDISHKDAQADPLLAFEYGFDNEGNRLFTRRNNNLALSERYQYDANQRLTSFKRGVPDGLNNIITTSRQKDYTLDGLGNWTELIVDEDAPETRGTNSLNQYTDVGGVFYTYDSNGNLIDDGVFTYTYNFENKITKITRNSDSAVIAEYVYDALNRRVQKKVGGTTTEYVYDDSRVIEERVTGVTTASYVYGNRLDEVVAMNRNGNTYFYHRDIIGSTYTVTDENGNIVESYLYDPYGAVSMFDGSGNLLTESAIQNPYLFTGRRYDAESGLYYYRARYLNPALGRFMSRDPKGYADSLNLYQYALLNPLRFLDPRGTATVAECDEHSISFDIDSLKKYIPGFMKKYFKSAGFTGAYKTCKKCCDDKKSPMYGKEVTDKELSFSISFSGDTGFVNTPWGIGWDIDLWLFESKGFIGLVARLSWGISGSLSAGTDNCNLSYTGKGCISGSLSLEALFGAASGEDDDSSFIKAYVSGGVTGTVGLCVTVKRKRIILFLEGSIGGHIRGVVGVWKFTYQRTFYELNVSFGPLNILSI